MDAFFDREESFGEQQFGQAVLGDRRRTRRLVQLVDKMVRHPGGTLPHKLNEPADLKAFYRLMDCADVTHAAVLEGHRQRTVANIAQTAGTVLIVHDTTELDYTTKQSLHNLGQIGNGYRRGYLCHNSLAVAADSREVLGLVHQILHRRAQVPKKETEKERRERQDRESRLWVEAVRGIGPTPPGGSGLCIDVCDRGADVFEFLEHEVTHGRHFVVRSAHSRRLEDADEEETRSYLHEQVRSLAPQGSRALTIASSATRTDRQTTVSLAFAPICLKAPGKRSGTYTLSALDLWVVRVWETKTPKDEPPLEWLLLTNLPVLHLAAAEKIVDYYECRPIIEEYHKAQKTGCALESFQFTHEDRLQPAIAVVSVVALTLLRLRDASRRPDATTRRATEVIAEDYVRLLSGYYPKRLKPSCTVHEFFYALARLGGHQNRRHDHPPGWLVLWRGWTTLQAMMDGANAKDRIRKKCG